MFTLPIKEIDYKAVVEFCQQGREEGLDLDYKSDWEKDLDHVLCAMANVQGGMVLIGVGEDPATRKPICPPVGVVGTRDELNQRAIQIAYDAIYPPVMPEVAVVPLPDRPDRSVVVIRVEASRLLHATDGRSRVYVKVADHKRGYDLATVSQLEWLFHQREKSVSVREQTIDRALTRANDLIGGWAPRKDDLDMSDKQIDKVFRAGIPRLRIYATPYYPTYGTAFDPPMLLNVANAIVPKSCTWTGGGENIPRLPKWRATSQGAYNLVQLDEEPGQYIELGSYGLVYFERAVLGDIVKAKSGDAFWKMNGAYLLSTLDGALLFIEAVYQRIGMNGPIAIYADLQHVKSTVFSTWLESHNAMAFARSAPFSQDDEISLVKDEVLARDLSDAHDSMIDEICCSMFWAYGYGDTREEISGYMATLRKKR